LKKEKRKMKIDGKMTQREVDTKITHTKEKSVKIHTQKNKTKNKIHTQKNMTKYTSIGRMCNN